MLAVGSLAPDFEADSSTGARIRLSSLRGQNVILYFFPKAFTSGCTAETRAFGQLAPLLAAKDACVLGVSIDTAETQTRFAAKCEASFPIVSDADRSIARAYGVLSVLGVSKRVTFFIDPQGTVQEVLASLLPGPHVARARKRFLEPG
jgi:thioredoxin-dependent peroxiredoxin